jgi:hypothetical protein
MKGSAWQEWAAFVNDVTGGNQFEEGLISLPPAVWRNYARALGGGPVSFSTGMHDSIAESDITKAPFVRKMYGEVGTRNDMGKYYEIANKAKDKRAAYKDALKVDMPTAEAMYKSNKVLIDFGGEVEKYNTKIGALYKDDIRIKDDTTLTDAQKKQELKVNEKERSDLHEQGLAKWRELVSK